MTHPEELLAGYVDGTLSDEERAVVDEHLPGCETCREELRLAEAAVTTLRALEDEPVPFGVTGRVLAEAGARSERRRALLWRRIQVATAGAAAAALVLVVALSLGGGGDDVLEMAGEGADAGAPEASQVPAATELAALPGLERQEDVTYDEAGIRSLAREAGERTGPTEDARYAPPDVALDCIRASGAPVGESGDQLVRLIEARYLDTLAYIAVFLEGPGAGQQPDAAVVWVTAVDDCRILTIADQRL